MSFWLREVAGWLLVLVGLLLFWDCYLMLRNRQVFEAGPLSVIAIIVFRGGIHLLKVAVAARICREARDRTKTSRPAPSAPRQVAQPQASGTSINPLSTRGR